MSEIKTGQIWGETNYKTGQPGKSIKVVRVEEDGRWYCSIMTDEKGEVPKKASHIRISPEEFEEKELLHDPEKEEKSKATNISRFDKVGEWFGDNPIQRFLKDNGYSQQVFAGVVGISVVSLRLWVKGRRPNDDNRKILSSAMRLSLEEFDKAWGEWLGKRPKTL